MDPVCVSVVVRDARQQWLDGEDRGHGSWGEYVEDCARAEDVERFTSEYVAFLVGGDRWRHPRFDEARRLPDGVGLGDRGAWAVGL
jgi:hypothetical protein